MEAILVKLFATALALSEVTIQPQAVKTHFDAVQDRTEVVQLLRDGCAHMRQAFDIESIRLDTFTSRTSLPVSSTMQTLVSLTETSSPAKWSMLRFSFRCLRPSTRTSYSPS